MTLTAPGRSTSVLLAASGGHGLCFVVPVLGALLVAVVARLRRADGFLRVHASAALRLQVLAALAVAVGLLPANLSERADAMAAERLESLAQVGGLAAAVVALYACVVSVSWLIDAAEQRFPRRTVGPAAVLVPRLRVVPGASTPAH